MNALICLINQNVDVVPLVELLRQKKCDKIVFCCTHSLFPGERESILAVFDRQAKILEWSDLVSDTDAQNCDDRASRLLNPRLAEPGFQGHYPGYHMEASGRLKNALIHRELSRRYPMADYYHSDGLGIVCDYWREQGSRELPPSVLLPPLKDDGNPGGSVSSGLEIMTANLPDDECIYVFVSDTRRLKFHPGLKLTVHNIDLELDDLIASGQAWEMLLKNIGMKGTSMKKLRLATTIHGYRSQLLSFNQPLYVIVDGYHPPNYPRTYIDLYDAGVIFEAREPITCQWFWRHGRSCQINPNLLEPVRFQDPNVFSGQKRPVILFALNHAGDWSALINRSDTDRLVMAAVNAAGKLPHADIVIRPHPTMAHPAHEGCMSRHRIETYVQACGQLNLSVSHSSLEADLDRADIVVSEYSQVVIDAVVSGCIGIVANLTGRRSFMATYRRMGLAEVTSAEALAATLDATIASPKQAKASLRKLADNHGLFQAAVSQGCPVCSSHSLSWTGRKGSFNNGIVFRCYRCCHSFLYPEPNDVQLEAYYRDVYNPYRNSYLGTWYLNFMVERAEAQYRFITDGLSAVCGAKGCNGWRIADIGCGIGALTERFRIQGADAYGYDDDDAVIAFGKKQFPEANIRQGKFQQLTDNSVHLLLMSHVVEHMNTLRSRLSALASQVKPGGFLFIEVPNTEPEMFNTKMESDGHIHFFTASSLRRLADGMGLTVVSCRSCGVTLSEQKKAIENGDAEKIYTASHQILRQEGDHTGIWLRCLLRVD